MFPLPLGRAGAAWALRAVGEVLVDEDDEVYVLLSSPSSFQMEPTLARPRELKDGEPPLRISGLDSPRLHGDGRKDTEDVPGVRT